MADVNSADCSPGIPVASVEVARQIRAVTDPLSKLIKLLRDLMKDSQYSSFRRNGETSDLTQGSSRAPNTKSDTIFLEICFISV